MSAGFVIMPYVHWPSLTNINEGYPPLRNTIPCQTGLHTYMPHTGWSGNGAYLCFRLATLAEPQTFFKHYLWKLLRVVHHFFHHYHLGSSRSLYPLIRLYLLTSISLPSLCFYCSSNFTLYGKCPHQPSYQTQFWENAFWISFHYLSLS